MAAPSSTGDVLSAEATEQWARRGFVCVAELFEPEVMAQALAEAAGLAHELNFPNREAPSTNLLALSPRLARAAAQLLGTGVGDVRLFEGQVLPPSPLAPSPLAPMHSTHSLLTPPTAPEALHLQVFLSSEGGVTVMDGGSELTVSAVAGDAVLLRSDCLQRVEPGTATQRIGLRRAACAWIAGSGAGFGNSVSPPARCWMLVVHGSLFFSRIAWWCQVSGMPRNWVASLSTPQRTLFGFPAAGDDYWSDDNIAAVRDHYAGAVSGWSGPEGVSPEPMDMSDYIAAQTNHASATVSLTRSPASKMPRPTLPTLPKRWAHKNDTLWASPEPALSQDDANALTPEQVQSWHEEGFVVVTSHALCRCW